MKAAVRALPGVLRAVPGAVARAPYVTLGPGLYVTLGLGGMDLDAWAASGAALGSVGEGLVQERLPSLTDACRAVPAGVALGAGGVVLVGTLASF